MITDLENTKEELKEEIDRMGYDISKDDLEIDGLIVEIANGDVDLINTDLFEWLKSDIDNIAMVEEAIMVHGIEEGLFKAIQMAQFDWNYHILLDALEELKKEEGLTDMFGEGGKEEVKEEFETEN